MRASPTLDIARLLFFLMLKRSVEQPSDALTGIVDRIRAEFTEMPGLTLTVEQAARLWSLDIGLCRTVLCGLEESRFLVRTRQSAFARLSSV